MRPKRRRPSRPPAQAKPPSAKGQDAARRPPTSERGAKAPTPPPAPKAQPAQSPAGSQAPPAGAPPAPPEPVQDDPRVQELESKVQELTTQLQGMTQDREQVKGVADRFQGMEDRMKSLLQLSEILSVRYNPFLEHEEPDVYDNRDPSALLPAPSPRPGAEVVPEPGEAAPPRKPSPAAPPPETEARAGTEIVPLGAEPGPAPVPSPDDGHRPAAQVPERAEVDDGVSPGTMGHVVQDGGPRLDDDMPRSEPASDPRPGAVPTPPDRPDELAAAAAEVLGQPEMPSVEAILWALETVSPSPAEPATVPQGNASHPGQVTSPQQGRSDGSPAPAPADAEPAAGAPPAGADARDGPDHARRGPRPAAPVPRSGDRQDAWSASERPVPGRKTASHHDPRRAYYALCWFERLAGQGDPSEIHLFIDHYARLGWVPGEDAAWLHALADGIAPRRDDLGWDDLQMTGPELARLHRDNLRFLERLFRWGFPENDPAAWDDQADAFLGGT